MQRQQKKLKNDSTKQIFKLNSRIANLLSSSPHCLTQRTLKSGKIQQGQKLTHKERRTAEQLKKVHPKLQRISSTNLISLKFHISRICLMLLTCMRNGKMKK